MPKEKEKKKRKLPEITLAEGLLRWQGLYVNGILVKQFHEIEVEDILEALKDVGFRFRFRRIGYDDGWLAQRQECGEKGLPEKLKDMKGS